jgi:hypothetical protein
MIKPKLDAKGQHIKDYLNQGEYFYSFVEDKYTKWAPKSQSPHKLHIYIDIPDSLECVPEKIKKYVPSIGQIFYYYDFEDLRVQRQYWVNDQKQNELLKQGNCFYSREDITMEIIINLHKAKKCTPEINDLYFYYKFGEGAMGSAYWRNSSLDRDRFKMGNCFRESAIPSALIKKVLKNHLGELGDDWIPCWGERYYYYNFYYFQVESINYTGCDVDRWKLKIGNYAKSPGELTPEKRKTILEKILSEHE